MDIISNVINKNKKIVIIFSLVWIIIILVSYVSIFIMDKSLTEKVNNIPVIRINWLEIFLHNISVAFGTIILGYISFGIIAIFSFLFHIYIVVYTLYFTYIETGSILYSTSILFTHGILEIFAMIICYILSTTTLRLLINKIYNKEVLYINKLKEKIVLLLIMTMTYLLASIVESYISSNLASLFL